MFSPAEKFFISLVAAKALAKEPISRFEKQAVIDLCSRVNLPVPAYLFQRMQNDGYETGNIVVQ